MGEHPVAPLPPDLAEAFRRGGELGRLMAARDWTTTPLGPPESWPAPLRFAVALLLSSRSQIVLFWGPELVALYNDAYAPTIGDKHPAALGLPAARSWSELWDDLEPLLEGVRASGEPFHARDRPFLIDRRGYLERVYFDVSYDPVRGDDGTVAGVLCHVSETTRRVLGEQRLRVARDVAQRIAGQPEEAVAREAASALTAEVGEIATAHVLLVGANGDTECDATAPGADPEAEGERLAFSLRAGTHDVGRLDVVLDPYLSGDEGLVTMLQQVADLIARTVADERAQRREQERTAELERTTERLRHVAKILERAILPDRLPELTGAAVAGRYRPGSDESEVGGDWYDVLPLGEARVALVIGDVVGRGVRAAAAMGQLRNALRAVLLGGAGPGEALTSLDRVAHAMPDATGSTVACAVLDVRTGELAYASAGHLPPLAVEETGDIAWLDGVRSVPLGVEVGTTYRQGSVQLAAGATVVLYTDGLVERRGQGLEEGLDRLATAAAERAGDPRALVDHAMESLVDGLPIVDDAAIVALTREPGRDGHGA